MNINYFCVLFYFVIIGVYSQESRKKMEWRKFNLGWLPGTRNFFWEYYFRIKICNWLQQVILNIAELYRKKLQYDLDRLGSYFSAETVFKHQYGALNNGVEIFQSQSLSGRDFKIVQKWSPNIEDQLAIYKSNTIPKYEKANFGMGLNVGAT